MIWMILVILTFVLGTGATVFVLRGKVSDRREIAKHNLQILKEQREKKREVLRELAELSLGLVMPEVLTDRQKQIQALDDELKAERGRLAITQAELEAVDTRLRELEEIERELESSALEASQELEMLKSQEKDIAERNQKLREELNSSLGQLEKLLGQLSHSREAVEHLNSAKTELVQSQTKISFYEEQIGNINRRYIELKKAYDALDIEYAQLYEKQAGL